MFFLVPIQGVGIPKKKIHLDGISEFYGADTTGVCCFYSIVNSIDLIGTCLKIL